MFSVTKQMLLLKRVKNPHNLLSTASSTVVLLHEGCQSGQDKHQARLLTAKAGSLLGLYIYDQNRKINNETVLIFNDLVFTHTVWFACQASSFAPFSFPLDCYIPATALNVHNGRSSALKDILRYGITQAEDYYWFAHGAVSPYSAGSGSEVTDSDGVGWPHSQPEGTTQLDRPGRRREIEEWITWRDKGNWWLFQR